MRIARNGCIRTLFLAISKAFLALLPRRGVIRWSYCRKGAMRLKRQHQSGSGDLFRARLDQIINMRHALVLLAQEIDWGWLDAEVGDLYAATGRAGVPTRFILCLLFLKQIHGLSDDQACARRSSSAMNCPTTAPTSPTRAVVSRIFRTFGIDGSVVTVR